MEPTEPHERLVLGDASTPRMRFSSSNGLEDVSTALWSIILSNPEKSGLAAIHSPEGREPLGFVSQPFRMWESCDLFPPGLGAFGPVSGGGRGNGFSFWVHLSPLFPPCSTRHDSLIASTRRPHAWAPP